MKSRRFRYSYRDSASKLHRKVGDILRTSNLFKGYKSFQEYPVNKVNPSFLDGRCHFDWVILDLKCVVECHGAQHYSPSTMGGISQEEAVKRFKEQQQRDREKKEAAEAAGFVYLEIPYTLVDDVTDNTLFQMYTSQLAYVPKEWNQEELARDEYKEKKNARAKEYRHQQYLKAKERKKQLRDK